MGVSGRVSGICTGVILIVSAVIFHAAGSYAFDTNIEKDLQERLIQSQGVLEKAEVRLSQGGPVTEEINRLMILSAGIRASYALLKEKFRMRGEDVRTKGALAGARQKAMEDGYLGMLDEYLSLAGRLDPASPSDKGEARGVIKTLKALLRQILPKHKRPLLGAVPYRILNYASREPAAGPGIRPGYKGGNKTVTPGDTKETEESPFSLETAAVAQSLNWSPVNIYEYVMNTIDTEWYWGCMKGAAETLRQKSGNDCDQATLLVALLRVSGFPARYVRGTVEFFAGGRRVDMDKARNLFGIDDPSGIAAFLQKAGIPYRPVITGGGISNFQVEHIWVETQVPYGNYRGAIIDDSDKTWLGLDTSIKIKDYSYNSPLDIYQQPALSNQLLGMKDEDLGSTQTQTPLEYLKEKLLTIGGQPAVTYKGTRALPAFILKILPSSMQFEQKLITHEYTEIPDELRHKVRFIATDPGLPAAEPLFDITLDTYKLSNRMITLTYEAESVEDQQIIDSYGGLDNTPAYLIRLRPVLKLNGERVVVGKDGLPMGAEHALTIELISPNGSETTTNTHIAGNVSVIGIISQKAVSSSPPSLAGEGGREEDAEQILYEEATHYIDRWNQAEEELASLLHLNITRPIPTVVTVGGVIDVTYLLGIPHNLTWKGEYIDANFRAIGVIPSHSPLTQGGDQERQKIFMQLSGLQGSVLEHRVFEDDLGIDSISTAKLFQAANSRQIPILALDKDTVGSAALPFEAGIVDDLRNAVNQNLLVKIPDQEMTWQDWTGTGYIKEDLKTNEVGYMLSGMIAGGMTAVSPDKWPQWLADILGKPYAGDYKTISITNPKNESVLFASPITVSGIALDADVRVTINGIEASKEGNAFTAGGIHLNRGINRITATAKTASGVTLTDSVTIKYKIPLRTYLTFPYDAANLSVSPIDIEGVASDPAAIISVNGISATVFPDGRYMARGLALSEGANQITAIATNPEGDTDTQTITANYKTDPPVSPIRISITSPANNETINRPSVLVKGTVTTTAEEVSIKVNGILAEVYNGQFVANHVPLTEGDNRIIANATDSNGGVGRAEVSVKANTTLPYVTLNTNITSGIPPLAAYFSVATELPNAVTSYQIDFEGDGVIDYTGETFEDIFHTYTTEGIYYPTVTVTDDQGNIYRDTIAITVLNKEKIDALLKGKWEGMKGKLIQGNIANALKYFSDSSYEEYKEIFELISPQLGGLVSTMRDIFQNNITQGIAEYTITRQQRGVDIVYFIHFVKDSNGIWRIDGF